jgi:ThiF family protein/JAB domain-containing protein similar to deubiquitination enzymes
VSASEIAVGDWVLRALERDLAGQPPERGGALLGPPGRPLLTSYLSDPEGVATSRSWAPSRALAARVAEAERAGGLELKGLAHSHPRGLDAPSAQDALELAEGLRRNGHLASYLAPIVTEGAAAPGARHELPLGAWKVSFHVGWRAGDGPARVAPVAVRAVPLLRDLERVTRELGGEAPEVFLTDVGAGLTAAGRLALPDLELLLVVPDQYPVLPPVLLATAAGGATEQLELRWALALAEGERLPDALRAHLAPPGPYRRAFGPPGGPALTRDEVRARRAGFVARYGGGDADARGGELAERLLARGEGLLSPELRARRALVAGCGSVGSYLAEQLVRAGVGAVALLDPERVEPENLSRTCYEAPDVGALKVEALARRLLRVAPALRCEERPAALESLSPEELDALVASADLVVAATDDPAAQRALNRFAYARGRPALFVGLYAGARGGEVILAVPERTACYLCATRTRHAAERSGGAVAAEVDYGTGRLHGEVALAADIQHVASAAAKLALSLLLPPGSAALASFAEEAVAAGASYLTLSTVPRYWFYPQLFGEVPGQGAYQAVWLTPARDPGCPVCGAAEGRVEPREVPLRAPTREAILAAAQAR